VNVVVADLHKKRTGVCKKVVRHNESITQVTQVRMDAIAPRITKCLYLLWLTRDLPGITILNVAARGGPLKV